MANTEGTPISGYSNRIPGHKIIDNRRIIYDQIMSHSAP